MNADDQKRRWLDNHPGLDLQSSDPSKSYQHNRRPCDRPGELQLSQLTLTGAQTILSDSPPPVAKALEGSEASPRLPASGDYPDSIKDLMTTTNTSTRARAKQQETAAAVRENLAMAAPYDILGEAGRGGMGVVFKARQKSLEREIAIKTLLSKKSEAADLHRFLAEARVTGYLDHPNIVPVHDLGVTAEGQVQMVMKLVHRAMAKINTRVFFNLWSR